MIIWDRRKTESQDKEQKGSLVIASTVSHTDRGLVVFFPVERRLASNLPGGPKFAASAAAARTTTKPSSCRRPSS